MAVGPDEVRQSVHDIVTTGPSSLEAGPKVCGGMDGLESSQEVFEIANHGLFLVAVKIRLSNDRSFEALEKMSGHAALFEAPVESVRVTAAAKKGQVGLADPDVIGGRVVVHLLMPLLQEDL